MDEAGARRNVRARALHRRDRAASDEQDEDACAQASAAAPALVALAAATGAAGAHRRVPGARVGRWRVSHPAERGAHGPRRTPRQALVREGILLPARLPSRTAGAGAWTDAGSGSRARACAADLGRRAGVPTRCERNREEAVGRRVAQEVERGATASCRRSIGGRHHQTHRRGAERTEVET